MAAGDSKRAGVSVLGVIVGAPLSYIVQRFLGAWGVLDAISDAFGKYLKTHVPPAAAGWTIALLFVGSLYGLLLWKVWWPRHIHHVDPAPERIGVGDKVSARIVRKAPPRMPMDDVLDQVEHVARWRRAGAYVREADSIERKLAQAQPKSAKYRDVSIDEALGWAISASWGKPYTGWLGIPAGLGRQIDPWKFLNRMVGLARDGQLTIWGKRDDPGYIEEIPASFWEDEGLTILDIWAGLITTGDNPYRDLKLNKSEVEAAWPHAGAPPP